MSDDVHARGEQISQPHTRIDTNTRRSFAGGVLGTIRFFAPSIVVGLLAPVLFPAVRRAALAARKGWTSAPFSGLQLRLTRSWFECGHQP